MKTLIVLGGPTASGKTDIAIEVAKHFYTEILSADSRQCFKELSIGVAIPSDEQLREIKHHFIHSHSIHNEMSAGIFEQYGLSVLDSIFQKNDFAVCVGGTGLYLRALTKGIDKMPEINQNIEKEILYQYNKNGIEWLQQEIKIQDSLFYKKGEIQNPHRALRALIFKLSIGQSILNFQTQKDATRPFQIKYFALQLEREILYSRINKRVELMMASGLLAEVEPLLPFQHLKALQTVGYQEFFSFFNQNCTLEESIDKVKQHTRNYAKRQITWFKNQENYQWVAPNYQNIINALQL